MFSALVRQFEDGLADIVDLWVQQSGTFVATSHLTISRSIANRVVLLLISTLDNLRDPGTRVDLSLSVGKITTLLTELPTPLQASDKKIAIIQCVKAMRGGLEQYLENCIIPDSIKLQAIKGLYRITDEIEIDILTGQNDLDQKHQHNIEEVSSGKTSEKTTYKSIFETTSNLVLITNESGDIVEVNPTAKIFFAGQQVMNRFCGDLLQINGDLDVILKRYKPDVVNEVTLEQDGITKTFNLQIRLLSKSYPMAKGLLFILNDITCAVDHRQLLEQRVVERTRALAKSEKLLDSLFQSIGQGILLLDYELEVIQANRMASEIYGIPPEVLIGSSYHGLTDSDGLEIMSEICKNLEEGEIRTIESTGFYVDGRRFPALTTATAMHLDNQLFWPLIVRDISKQKEMEADIVEQKQQAEEMNVTLRTVLNSIENERKQFEENLSSRIRSSLLPSIDRIRQERDKESRNGYLSVLEQQMISLTADFTAALDGDLLKLSKTELRICRFIKAGLTGKEICDTMNLSFETIQTHRKNIRKKLGLRGRDVNLHTFLADRVL